MPYRPGGWDTGARLHSNLPSADTVKKGMSLQAEFDLLSTWQAESLSSKTRHGCYKHGKKAGQILAHQMQHRTANQRCSKQWARLKKHGWHKNQLLFFDFLSIFIYLWLNGKPPLHWKISLRPSWLWRSAIRSMQSGKSAGLDGYPNNFLKKNLRPTLPFITVSLWRTTFI